MSHGPGRGNASPGAEALSVSELTEWAPKLPAILREMGLPVDGNENATLAFLCEEAGLQPADVLDRLAAPSQTKSQHADVSQLDIIGGRSKNGVPEPVRKLSVAAGQVVALVGATGSGKSQVLADVESLTPGDSPSARVVWLDGQPPADELRWSPSARPVAQVSQGMRFLLDTSVGAFLEMHASCRDAGDASELAAHTVEAACHLCGEPFGLSTELAALSGGQSRALMIADVALISRAPIILVDEIENAGIDRERALSFLTGQGKITLAATHDPLLALRADMRVILGGGAMQEVLHRSEEEVDVLEWLERHEHSIAGLREALRGGRRLTDAIR